MTGRDAAPGDRRPRLVLWALVPATPASILRPNARADYRDKARAAKALREASYLAAVDALNTAGLGHVPCPPDGPLWVDIGILWERGRNKAGMDFDAAVSSCKAAIDGAFAALGTDDRRVAGIAVRQGRHPEGTGTTALAVYAGEAPWVDGTRVVPAPGKEDAA